jgi:hypothetical protein
MKKEHAGIHIPDYMGSTQKATILISTAVKTLNPILSCQLREICFSITFIPETHAWEGKKQTICYNIKIHIDS